MSRPGDLFARLPRTLEAVEAFCLDFRSWRIGSFCPPDRFASELLLREALANGVLHGGVAERPLWCAVRCGTGRLLIAVFDGGPGFDWRNQRQTVADCQASSGRGLEIYSRYAHRVRFNALGNGVALIRRFSSEQKDNQS